jgi:hypothetical protein
MKVGQIKGKLNSRKSKTKDEALTHTPPSHPSAPPPGVYGLQGRARGPGQEAPRVGCRALGRSCTVRLPLPLLLPARPLPARFDGPSI